MASQEIGIDLGGTKTNIGLVDHSGKIIKNTVIKTRVQDGPQAIVDDIISAVKELANGHLDTISSIGVGMAGQIEKNTGIVHFAPNLGWKDFPLKKALNNSLHLPVAITNDVRTATWGEWLFGAGRNCSNFVCIFVGTGIGGGIVIENQMVDGSSNTAGEVGHMILDIHGPQCTCGSRGCFDALAGGGGIARKAKFAVATDPAGGKALIDLAGGNPEDINAGHVFEAYRRGIPLAILIIEGVKEALVAGVTNVVNAFNPSRIIIGGGVINKNPELMKVIQEGVKRKALKAATENLEIVPALLTADAGVIGAAAYSMQMIRGDKHVG